MSNKRYTVLVRHTEVYEKEFSLVADDKYDANDKGYEAAGVYDWTGKLFPTDERTDVLSVTRDT